MASFATILCVINVLLALIINAFMRRV